MVLTAMHGVDSIKVLSEDQLHKLESDLIADIARTVLAEKPIFDKLAERSRKRLSGLKPQK